MAGFFHNISYPNDVRCSGESRRRWLYVTVRHCPIPDLQRFGALPSAALLIRPMRPDNLLARASTTQFTQESLSLPQVKRI